MLTCREFLNYMYAIYTFAYIFNSICQNIFLKISSLRSIYVTIYIILKERVFILLKFNVKVD